MTRVSLIEHEGWSDDDIPRVRLSEERNFIWRNARHAFWYLLPGDIVLSVVWQPGTHRGSRDIGGLDDIQGYRAWYTSEAIEERERIDAREEPIFMTVDSVLETVRVNAENSVEILAYRRCTDARLFDDDYGWVDADELRAVIEYFQAHPHENNYDEAIAPLVGYADG